MNPWVETAGALLLAVGGVLLASRLSHLQKPYWMSAYFVALAIIILFGLQRYINGLEFIPPFSWLAAGRVRFALCAIVAPLLVLTPLQQLPNRRLKILLGIFTGFAVIQYSLMPFLMPALIRKDLLALKTRIGRDGVCMQQTDYNCGPAAAVTALRQLGLPAEEGEIAIWAHTSKFGTATDILAETLQSHYGARGLSAELRQFKDLRELAQAGLTLAVIKYGFLLDHFVTVLNVTDKEITVGDPLSGKSVYSYEEFAKVWRFSGIVLKR
jgi:predicted double-glycine peptidase